MLFQVVNHCTLLPGPINESARIAFRSQDRFHETTPPFQHKPRWLLATTNDLVSRVAVLFCIARNLDGGDAVQWAVRGTIRRGG